MARARRVGGARLARRAPHEGRPARALARRAARRFQERRRLAAARLAASFAAWLAGDPIADDGANDGQPNDITMQTRAFTLAANHRIDASSVEAVIARPPDTWSQRLDLLSTREALALAGGEDLR